MDGKPVKEEYAPVVATVANVGPVNVPGMQAMEFLI